MAQKTIVVESTNLYKFPSGASKLAIASDAGRYSCVIPELYDIINSHRDSKEPLEVVIEDSKVVSIVNPKTVVDNEQLTQDNNVDPFPESGNDADAAPKTEPAETKVAKSTKSSGKKAEPKKAAPATQPQDNEDVTEPEASDADEMPESGNINAETRGLTKADELKVEQAFPLLRAEEIEVRIGQLNDWGCTLLLYKNARCDQERLDAKYGPLGWQTDFQLLDGQLFCTISVRNPETGEWIKKTDVGTPSMTEPEKGRASDAFKRAAVQLGSGRELYDAPAITIKAANTVIEKNTKGKLVCKDTFSISLIEYNKDRKISALEIYSAAKKQVVFKWKRAK